MVYQNNLILGPFLYPSVTVTSRANALSPLRRDDHQTIHLLTKHIYRIMVKYVRSGPSLAMPRSKHSVGREDRAKLLAASLVLALSDMSGDPQLDARMDTQR